MIFQKTDFPIHKYIHGLLLALIMATIVSKTGMNLLAPILTIYSLVFYFSNKSHLPPVVNTLFISCFSIYGLGTIGSYLGHTDISDVTEFARKNTFLLILPLLSAFLSNKKNRDVTCYSFLVACSASALYGIYLFSVINNFNINIRVNGFLEYSRHTNVMLCGIAIGLSYLTVQTLKKKAKALIITAILLCILSMVISGTRAGYLCLAIMLPVVLCTQYRRYIPHAIAFSAISLILASAIFPQQVQHVTNRITSIGDTEKNISNMARITMWKGGIAYIEDQSESNLSKFLFGSGMENSEASYHSYLHELSEAEKKPYQGVDGRFYGGSDFHNSYLDLTIKSGVIYSVIFITGLIVISVLSLKKDYQSDPASRAVFYYLVAFYPLVVFYTMFQDYSMIATTVALALILGRYIELSQPNNQEQ